MENSVGGNNITFFHICSNLDDTVYDVDDFVGGDDIIFFHKGSGNLT